MKKVMIVLFLLFFIICIVLWFYKDIEKYELYFETSFDIDTIKKHQFETIKSIFGRTLECKSIPISTSQGLVIDSSIVCDVTKHIPRERLPVFYFETYPENFDENGYLFVNLDYTDFKKLRQPHSPKNILCKTRQTYQIVKDLFPYKNVVYTGFTSADRYLENISKNMKGFIHIPGKSPHKGTVQVVAAWSNHPNWPLLTLVCRDEVYNELIKTYDFKKILNINVINTFLSEKKLFELMNQNGIHICTSKNEGFGHYLNEARSTSAVVLYTNQPPMNEMFKDNESGIAVSAIQGPSMNDGICPTYLVTIDSIKESVENVLRKNEKELYEIGRKARESFLRDDQLFREKMNRLFN